jgi:hypothetical protein
MYGCFHEFRSGRFYPQKKLKVEVLFNVTDALGRGAGNSGSNSVLEDPIVIGAKFLSQYKAKALRFGMNFNIINGTDLSSGFIRTSTNQFYSLSLGVERRQELQNNLMYYYGADLQYYNDASKTNVDFFNGSSESLSVVRNGPGIVALLGFRWNITPRFALSTEASLALQVINNYRYLTDINGFKDVLEDKLETRLRPVMPGAIFLTFEL